MFPFSRTRLSFYPNINVLIFLYSLLYFGHACPKNTYTNMYMVEIIIPKYALHGYYISLPESVSSKDAVIRNDDNPFQKEVDKKKDHLVKWSFAVFISPDLHVLLYNFAIYKKDIAIEPLRELQRRTRDGLQNKEMVLLYTVEPTCNSTIHIDL